MKKNKMKKGIGILLAGTILAWNLTAGVQGEDGLEKAREAYQAGQEILKWEKEGMGIKETDPLFQGDYLEAAGTSTADWIAFSAARMGLDEGMENYRNRLTDYVEEKYKTETKLSPNKATEWHRISLTLEALGTDPRDVGQSHINLIADGVYNRDKTTALDQQGVNGLIWGLITLDSGQYETPDDASADREQLIERILEQRTEDGGFSVTGKEGDVDLTAMALSALAPYQDSKQEFTVTNVNTGETTTEVLSETVEGLKNWLASCQNESGTFTSAGVESLESTAQVIIALSALGEDAAQEEAFYKDGKDLIEILLSYQMKDGGFCHDLEKKESDEVASQQALLAITAYCRAQSGMGSVFSFTDGGTEETLAEIYGREEAQGIPAVAAIAAGVVIIVAAAVVVIKKRKGNKTEEWIEEE